MEATINGYHILQLSAKSPKETKEYSEITNEMGEGHFESVLFGTKSGNRSFALDFPVIDMNTASCELDGIALKPAEYLLELFDRQKTEGELFAIQSPINNQYNLCRFSDRSLTLEGIYQRLFTGAAIFQQVRRPGVSVFDVSKIPGVFAEYDFNNLGFADNTNITDISDSSGNNRTAAILGDIGAIKPKYKANQQNGRGVARFTNAGGSETWPLFLEESFTFYWALIVARYDGATFADYNGALSALTSNTIFVGNKDSGTWFDQEFSNVYFSKNGIAYPQATMPAPMSNAFTISLIQVPGGLAMDGLQIGRDRDFSETRTWKGDIGHIIVGSSPLIPSTRNEMLEYIITLWKI
jgi:hypothetical protein